MKQYLLIVIFLAVLILASCTVDPYTFDFFTAELEQEENLNADFNFCAHDNDYFFCKSFALTSDSLELVLEVTSSDVRSIDSIVFELPDEGRYCTADTGNGFLTTENQETYTAAFIVGDSRLEEECRFEEYIGQDVQLSFQVTLTLDDGSIVTEEGDVTDTVE